MPIKRFYCDLETTGTDPARHGIIQFSAIVTIDGERTDQISLVMQPGIEDEIEDSALEKNGIARAELFIAERLTAEKAYTEIARFLARHVSKFDRKDKFFWIGYNAEFDARFTRAFFEKQGDHYFGSWFFMPILCVMGLAGYLLIKRRQELADFKLRTVYGYLCPAQAKEYAAKEGKQDDKWHDALFDIERTMDIELALRKLVCGQRMIEQGRRNTAEQPEEQPA